LKSALVALIE